MNKINFTAKDNFPLSSDTMEMMQQMIGLSTNAALLGGTNYILSGCVDDGTTVGNGVVVINGELLPFEGGTKKTKITIQQTSKTLTAFGVNYPEAYIYRTAKFSDTGEYNWSDFVQVLTSKQLQERIEAITGDIPGVVKMFAGMVSKIPDDYMLCNGDELQISSYPELYDMIGISFGGNGQTTFNLPDLRGRFIVGYDNTDADYNAINNSKNGGLKLVELNTSQIPEHRHVYTDDIYANQGFSEVEPGFPTMAIIRQGQTSASNTGLGTAYYTSKIGGGIGHENRPPYFTLAYIIKIK
jgi:microcystin-dependent protein